MDNYQEQQPTTEQPARRGIRVVTNNDFKRHTVNERLNTLEFKPVDMGTVGKGSLQMLEYQNPPDEKWNDSAVSLDRDGNIIKGSKEEFWKKGYYQVRLQAFPLMTVSIRNPLAANFWIKEGPTLKTEFYHGYSDNKNTDIWLPLDLELLKELRVSIETPSGGGKE